MPITYVDRMTGAIHEEKIYCQEALEFLYGDSCFSRWVGRPLNEALSRFSFFSACVGWWQKQSCTRRKILPFIQEYGIDSGEFADPIDSFTSFNDFFVRKLRPECRPIDPHENAAIIPADGRYMFFPDISQEEGFLVKGRKFDVQELIQDTCLAEKYRRGTMILARLCPADYHRFHFSIDCIPGRTWPIQGFLYSVNPIALRKNIKILVENKRTLCRLQSRQFGEVLWIEVGATNVGSIHQTYVPESNVKKGEEKGYFSFGGSTLILLFEPGKIVLDADLLAASKEGMEIRCLMGQSMGTS